MRDKLQSIGQKFSRRVKPRRNPAERFPIAYKPQTHENEIVAHFTTGGRQLFTLPHQPAVERNVVLCFTNRCGSNWLSALLAATGLIGHADEFFNAPRLIRTATNTNANSFSEAIYNQATALVEQVENSFICKLSWDQLYFFAKTRIIPEIMPNTQYILMRRNDIAAQALSMCVAEQTGQWTSFWNSGKNGKRDLNKITDMEIQHAIDEVTFKNHQFRRFFGTFGITPIEVIYEDLVANPQQELERLVEALNLNPKGRKWKLDQTKVKLKKQSDTVSEERVQAFYANMQAHAAEIQQISQVETVS